MSPTIYFSSIWKKKQWERNDISWRLGVCRFHSVANLYVFMNTYRVSKEANVFGIMLKMSEKNKTDHKLAHVLMCICKHFTEDVQTFLRKHSLHRENMTSPSAWVKGWIFFANVCFIFSYKTHSLQKHCLMSSSGFFKKIYNF